LALIIFTAFSLIVIPEMWHLLSHSFLRGGNIEGVKNLTGRSFVWSMGMEAFKSSPIVGSGYSLYPKTLQATGHMHNVFMEIAVGMGLFGLFAILFIIGWLLINMLKTYSLKIPNDPVKILEIIKPLIIGYAVIVYSQTSAGVAYYSWPMIGLFVALIYFYSFKRIRNNTRQEHLKNY
jgi:O-antigen ligase